MTNSKIKCGSGGTRKRIGGTRKRKGGKRVGGTRKRIGGMHKRRAHRKRRKGGAGHAGVLATAALPFGLFGLQKLFQKGRTRRQVRRVGKVLKKDLRKLDVRRYLK